MQCFVSRLKIIKNLPSQGRSLHFADISGQTFSSWTSFPRWQGWSSPRHRPHQQTKVQQGPQEGQQQQQRTVGKKGKWINNFRSSIYYFG